MFKVKNDSKYHWTNHVVRKMAFYGLSPDRVKRVIRSPKRVEEGIAENTVAVMQPSTNLKKPSEVRVMSQLSSKAGTLSERSESKGRSLDKLGTISQGANRKIIISAWRYPGVSPVGKQIPIPQDILEELKNEGVL